MQGLPVDVEHPLQGGKVGQQGKDNQPGKELLSNQGKGQYNKAFKSGKKAHLARDTQPLGPGAGITDHE